MVIGEVEMAWRPLSLLSYSQTSRNDTLFILKFSKIILTSSSSQILVNHHSEHLLKCESLKTKFVTMNLIGMQ